MAYTRTAKGTFSNKTPGTTGWTAGSVPIASGTKLIVGVASRAFAGNVTAVSWNGISLTQDAGAGEFYVSIWSLDVATGATGSLVITQSNDEPLAVAVEELAGLTATGVDQAAATRSAGSTTPSSGATATTTQNDEYLFGVVATQGPNGDTAGTWGGDTATAGQRLGTTGGSASSNVTVSTGYGTQTATGTRTASKSGITSRAWGAAIATYKVLTSVTPVPGAGALTLSSVAPSLATALSVGAATLALSGLAPAVSVSQTATPAAGTMVVTGQAPSLSTRLGMPAGALTIQGQAPVLTLRTGIDVPAGPLALSGPAPAVAVALTVPIPAGTLSLTGPAPAIASPSALTPSAGGLALTGLAPVLSVPVTVAPAPGALAWSGVAPAVAVDSRLTPAGGGLTLAGQAPSIAGVAAVAPGVGSLALQGQAPSLATVIAAPVGSLTVTGQPPTLSALQSLTPAAGSLALVGPAPALQTAVGAPVGSLTLTGRTPALVAALAPNAGALALAGPAPVLRTAIAIPRGVLALSGQSIAVGGNVTTLTPGRGALALAGLAPTVVVGDARFLTSYTIELELAGLGLGWTDVTADLTDADIVLDYGIKSNRPDVRVCGTGTLTFQLRNDDGNSGGTLGWYSPFHASRRSGFNFGIRVRYTTQYFGVPYRWMGRLNIITAVPGQFDERVTSCVAFDWMDEAARTPIQAALQQDSRSDEVFSALLANVPLAPDQTSIDEGSDSYTFALDNIENNSKVSEGFAKLAMSEVGYIGQKRDSVNGQTVFFESRRRRALTSAIRVALDETQVEMLDLPGQRSDIINHVRATVHPRRVDTGASTVISQLDTASVGALHPGASLTLFLDYTDPVQRDTKIGAYNQVVPVATTDYTMNAAADGSGADLTASCSVSATFFAAAWRAVITNNSTSTAFITKLQVRGDGIYALSAITSERTNAASIATYGDNVVDLDLLYQSDLSFGQSVADYIATLYGTPAAHARGVRFLANQSPTLMAAALQGEISDKITLQETVSGLTSSTPFYINAIKHQLGETGLLWCTWLLVPADRASYWQLGSAGASELGTSTVLGF